MPYERRGTAKFGCKLSALRLEHIANNDPRSFSDEQASLGRALTACTTTDEYDFPFETVHFALHCRPRPVPPRERSESAARCDGLGKALLPGAIARTQLIP